MIFLDIEQRSEAWHTLRSSSIGASDASIILNLNPYKSRETLWKQKMGLLEPEPINAAMQHGIDLEDEARARYEEIYGVKVYPKVCKSAVHDFMIASLDGISDCGKYLVEIKCPGVKTHRYAEENGVPEIYFAQCQHQLAVTGLDHMYYFSFYNKEHISILVKSSDKFINWMIEKEKRFYESLINFRYEE